MGEAFASPLELRSAAVSGSSLSMMPPESSSMTMCRTAGTFVDARATGLAIPWARAGRGGATLAGRKSTQQLVQPEALLQLGPVQLTVIVLLQERHEFVFP